MEKHKDFYSIELEAKCIGRAVPDLALRFPDVKPLAQGLPLADFEQGVPPEVRRLLSDGQIWLAKLALAGGPEMHRLLSDANWEELSRRDRELGEQYRAALARQGVQFRLYKPPAATQPNK